MENEKRKRKITLNKPYLATLGEDIMDSNNEEEKDEKALFCLIAFDDKVTKVFDLNIFFSSEYDDEIDNLYHKLYDSLVKDKKYLKFKIAKNESLVEKN